MPNVEAVVVVLARWVGGFVGAVCGGGGGMVLAV